MIFSSRELEEAIAANELSSWEKTKYLVFAVLVCSIAHPINLALPTFSDESPSLSMKLVFHIGWIANLVIVFLGIKRCFRTNKAIDDSAFVERFILLNLPAMIKYMLIMIPLVLVSLTAAVKLKTHYLPVWEWFGIYTQVLSLLATYFFYVFLNRSFVRLGARIDERKPAEPASGKSLPETEAAQVRGNRTGPKKIPLGRLAVDVPLFFIGLFLWSSCFVVGGSSAGIIFRVLAGAFLMIPAILTFRMWRRSEPLTLPLPLRRKASQPADEGVKGRRSKSQTTENETKRGPFVQGSHEHKFPSLGKVWLRGWHVIFMVFVTALICSLCMTAFRALPDRLHTLAFLVFFMVFGPPIYYWLFIMFYPNYYEPQATSATSEPPPKPESSICLSCMTVLPVGTDACPKCGWSYKLPEQTDQRAGQTKGDSISTDARL